MCVVPTLDAYPDAGMSGRRIRPGTTLKARQIARFDAQLDQTRTELMAEPYNSPHPGSSMRRSCRFVGPG
jgi:hypothetical protein